MKASNRTIAYVLTRVATFLEVAGEDRFKFLAYRRAGRTIGRLEEPLHQTLEAGGELPDLPGIGRSISAAIDAIIKTGTTPLLTELELRIPPPVIELIRIRGLGASKVGDLMRAGVDSIDKLAAAVDDGSLAAMHGMGHRSADRIRRSLGEYLAHRGRFLRHVVTDRLAAISEHLESSDLCTRVHPAGSVRRGRESAGDLDILVVSDEPEEVLNFLATWDDAISATRVSSSHSQIATIEGLQIEVYVAPPESAGNALALLSGSGDHLEQVLALRPGGRVENGVVFAGNSPALAATEKEFYDRFGLPLIPPELREGRGEVEAAQAGRLPRLLEPGDLRGDLHMHTPHSDGLNSMHELAQRAQEKGYEYIAFADHTQNVAIANGMTAERTRIYLQEIERINAETIGIELLKGIEVDILKDGTLDLPDELLRQMDVVIASVHSHFNLSEREMTTRVLRAMDSRFVTTIGHPTCRLVGSRSCIPLDMEQIFAGARDTGTLLELNANPERLDLNDLHCRKAQEMGILVAISTDAHRTEQLDNMQFGVTQARRGWLEPGDVANTRSLTELRKVLHRKR